jgi:protein arginine N-methyltransferase 1
MLPDKAVMYICGIEDSEYKQTKINFWDSVYGFDMSCIREMAILEPLVERHSLVFRAAREQARLHGL